MEQKTKRISGANLIIYLNTALLLAILAVQAFIIYNMDKSARPGLNDENNNQKDKSLEPEHYMSDVHPENLTASDSKRMQTELDFFFNSIFSDPESLFANAHRIPVNSRIDNIRRTHEDINRMFNRAFSEFRLLRNSPGIDGVWNNLTISPAMDMRDNGLEYVISISLPDVKQGDINVSLEGRLLSITAMRAGGTRHAQGIERIERRIRLPGAVKPKQMRTSFEDNILKIRIPKNTGPDTHAFLLQQGLYHTYIGSVAFLMNKPEHSRLRFVPFRSETRRLTHA